MPWSGYLHELNDLGGQMTVETVPASLKKNLLQNLQAKFNQTRYKLFLGSGNSSSNKRPGLLQRGDNYKNVKIGWGNLKIFFSRTCGPILTRLDTNYPTAPQKLKFT
jgi:hypothetical protein